MRVPRLLIAYYNHSINNRSCTALATKLEAGTLVKHAYFYGHESSTRIGF